VYHIIPSKRILNSAGSFCSNFSDLEHLLKEMFRLARDELIVPIELSEFNDDLYTNKSLLSMTESDMGFYRFNFGMTMIERRRNIDSNNINAADSLVYYRIWKNANDNIRRIMYRYYSSELFGDEGKIYCLSAFMKPILQIKVSSINISFRYTMRRY